MNESGSDYVLELVLERVDSHISLIRAAAVCRRWRRAIADAAFLRRYHSLHAPAPPVAGYYCDFVGGRRSRVGPVFTPSSPSVVDARHFSLDFLPGGAASWTLRDSRGSLLLLRRVRFQFCGSELPDMVVCEPLTRRYRCIYPPADLDNSWYCLESYFIDGDADEAGGRISLSNFRVLGMFNDREGDTHVAMYTVGSSWSEKNIDHITPSFNCSCLMGHGGGCWYFVQGRALIILDGSTSDFSSSELPPLVEDWDSHALDRDFFITNGRDGKLRIFTVFDGTMKVFVRLEGGEWMLEKRVLLSEATRDLPGYKPSFFSTHQFVHMVGAGYVILSPMDDLWMFSINLETMEAAPAVESMASWVYGCELPWPPTLHACLDG
ncbi:unnamed protein product [Urochloa decumbens]|uniref:F-box domain-containing protein n=1 Tax=Urochloa decumbens TaxID=240449 RepID=A0ABC8WCZ5_9POAL